MSRVPVGKVLLRNVIRHTDAHNKIQEESEMWKMREMEKQTPVIQQKRQPTKLAPDFGVRCALTVFMKRPTVREGEPQQVTPLSRTAGRPNTGPRNSMTLRPATPTGGGTVDSGSSILRSFTHTATARTVMRKTTERKRKHCSVQKHCSNTPGSANDPRNQIRNRKSNPAKNGKERRERTATHPATRQAQTRVTEKRGEPGGNGKEPRKRNHPRARRSHPRTAIQTPAAHRRASPGTRERNERESAGEERVNKEVMAGKASIRTGS
ncbi:uncharacterized protein NKAPD1-like isoform X3 [Acipenser ruthenus]|uniref:uncharacterized protein NKAPD1-like isoform X3 n=1 Tax=Acipenser ruthenus TaxID=7906 RepID=UPI0027427E48|nr:uncharacterized protein NKAPD1-like isoform X3 [Acipenser ruthenus]